MDALKNYGSMKFIIERTDDEIEAAYEKMGGIGSPQSDGMPRTHNTHAAEDRMIKGIEEINMLKEHYQQAMEYMVWPLPAWEKLSEDECYVMDAFYSKKNKYGSSATDVADYFGIERAFA